MIKNEPQATKRSNSSKRSNQIHLRDWISQIRAYLIVIEQRNIEIRCEELTEIINHTENTINQQLFGYQIQSQSIKNNDEHKFEFLLKESEINKYLSYITKWNGLSKSSKTPTTYKDYQNKARNWLNGRRSKKYGGTLFSDMIIKCKNVKLFLVVWICSYMYLFLFYGTIFYGMNQFIRSLFLPVCS